MAERRATVDTCEGARVRLRADGPCDECGGCGGRCNLFAADADQCIELDASAFEHPPTPGSRVVLTLPDGWLRRAAWRAYGLLTVALVSGAGAGHVLGRALAMDPDPLSVLGAVVALALAMPGRRAEPPPPHVRLLS